MSLDRHLKDRHSRFDSSSQSLKRKIMKIEYETLEYPIWHSDIPFEETESLDSQENSWEPFSSLTRRENFFNEAKEILQCLVNHPKIDFNVKDPRNRTPLHFVLVDLPFLSLNIHFLKLIF
jgi:hypothetical protein